MSDEYVGSARHCSVCDTNWPMSTDYERCPRGHGDTFVANFERPITYDAAKKIRQAHDDFHRYYNGREEHRESVIAEYEAQFAAEASAV